MKYIKDWFMGIVHSAKGAVAPTIVAALIFFVTFRFFGMENTMIAPFATLSFLRFTRLRHNLNCMLIHYLIYLAMAGLAFLACINVPMCIIVNALALFWLAYLLIDEYQPNNYFASGMALIFFQIAPATGFQGLAMRGGALTVSFVIILLFVVIPRLLGFGSKQADIRDMIQSGFENCREQMAICRQMEAERKPADPELRKRKEDLRNALDEINHQGSMEIYAANRSNLRPKGRMSWYCRFILAFQVLNYLFLTWEKEGHPDLARNILHNFSDMFENETPAADYKCLRVRVNKPDIRNFRFRFALRMVLVVTPCMVFAYASGLENAYWLVISVFFMMIPYSDETGNRVKQRVTGTLCGLVACFVLLSLFPGLPGRVTIMTIANFLIYSATSYAATVAYITCSALSVQSLNAAVLPVLGERLLYTLIGGLIALLANRFVFTIHAKKQIAFLEEMLGRIKWKLGLFSPEEGKDDPERIVYLMQPGGFVKKEKAGNLDEACIRHQTDQLIIKSYLISYRLKVLNATLPPEDQIQDMEEKKHRYMVFMAKYLLRQLARQTAEEMTDMV